MKEAMLYEKLAEHKVRCNLCAHRCIIADGEAGRCHVRQNREGTLYSLVYGRAVYRRVEPVEKKALFHLNPGSFVYSIATAGCNFRCQWCQNWEISQVPCMHYLPMGQALGPEQVVAAALQAHCSGIAYAHTEPTAFFEYAHDIARLAHEAGLTNIYVTNGYMTEAALQAISPYLDAANVDLKTFYDDVYRRLIGARLQPVLDTLQAMKRLGIWLEVTTLVIPGVNDHPSELADVARFLVETLGEDTPWHIRRFFPTYQMHHIPPTPIGTLNLAREIGLEQGLHHVYIIDAPDRPRHDTICPRCGKTLIRRYGVMVLSNEIRSGRCPGCGAEVAGLGL